MGVELQEIQDGYIMQVRLTGKLSAHDYHVFLPEFERQIEKHGKIRLVVELTDFHGWEMGALWEDIKFDFKHFRDIERLAIVGESSLHKGMAWFCKPFTTAKIKYFEHEQLPVARQWITEDQD